MAALLIGILGSLGTAALGIGYLGLTPAEAAWSIVVSNIAGFLGLLLVVRAPTHPAGGRLLAGAARTWLALSVTYLSILWTLGVPLRTLPIFSTLLLPLILAAFFQVPLFGRIQDVWVARRQRRSRVL